MPLGDTVRNSIVQQLEPGPPPSEVDESGRIYAAHDARVALVQFVPTAFELLESALGNEHGIDATTHVSFHSGFRTWRQLVIMVRTDARIHLLMMDSRGVPIVWQFPYSGLRIEVSSKDESRLNRSDGGAVLTLGTGTSLGNAGVVDPFVAIARSPSTSGAGWYADPSGRHGMRWWDGQQWTAHVSDGGGTTSLDPL
jgi:hypothetical protein